MKKSFALHLFVITVALSACGKGEVQTTAHTTTIQGIASKGIIKQGKVEAFAVKNGAIAPSALASTVTDDQGKYTLQLTGYTGPLVLKVSPDSSGLTTTNCEVRPVCSHGSSVVPYGAAMPANFSMQAAISSTNADTIEASISPFTHMAAKYAEQIALSSDSIRYANEKVQTLLQLEDLQKTRMIDLTDKEQVEAIGTDPAQLRYSYLAAAIAQLAEENYNGDINTALNILTTTYLLNNGELVLRSSNSGAISLQQLYLLAAKAYEDDKNSGAYNAKEEVLQDLNIQLDELAQAPVDTNSQTEITPPNASQIAKARELITALRTWLPVAREELEQGSNSFASEVQASLQHSAKDAELAAQAQVLSIAAVAHIFYQTWESSGQLPSSGSYNLKQTIQALVGQDYYQDVNVNPSAAIIINGDQISISNAQIGIIQYDYEWHYNAETYSWDRVRTSSDNLGTATIDLSLQVPTSLSGSSFRFSSDLLRADTPSLTMESSNSYVQVDFDRSVDLRQMPVINSLAILAGGESSIRQKASSVITNPVTFTGKSTLGKTYIKEIIKEYCYTYYYDYYNGYPTAETYCYDYTTADLAPSNFHMEGSFANTNNSINASFDFVFHNAAAFSARTTDGKESPTNWRNIDATLTVDVKYANLPPATLKITGGQSQYKESKLSLNFSYEAYAIRLEAAEYEDNSREAFLSVGKQGSTDRLVLMFDDEMTALGRVIVDGIVIGSIRNSNVNNTLVMEFQDGSFESIAF